MRATAPVKSDKARRCPRICSEAFSVLMASAFCAVVPLVAIVSSMCGGTMQLTG
ncbi:MAG: hypothetical protein MZV64_23150 [Ignavibacteriales bacterium]|nr:hypothetical protein [Ignavibacteriales bacterium]